MSLSNYGENYYLDSMFEVSGLYVGLSRADPTEDGSGLDEPSGNGYARVSISGSTWNAASDGSKTNGTAITFPTATGSWGTITHMGIFDAATSGNLLWSTELTSSKGITTGQTLQFPASSVTITLN
jgi:hypothetical protein